MTKNTDELNQTMFSNSIFKLVEDYGVDVITPVDMDGVGQVGEIRIATGVREPKISKQGKQIHRSIYSDALLNENNLFRKHHNQEVFVAEKGSSSLQTNRVNTQILESIPKNIADVDEAIKNQYVLRLFYMIPADLMDDFDRVFHFLDDNLEIEDMIPTIAKTVFGKQLTGDEDDIEGP